MKPRLLMILHYLGGAGLLPSVAQPPLPLHEFFPLQPLSPVLQPPLPLQELLPLQECLSDFFPICSETPGFPVETLAWVVAANEPLISPAIAAPATIAFFVIGTFLFCLLALTATPSRRKSIKLSPDPALESGYPIQLSEPAAQGKSKLQGRSPAGCQALDYSHGNEVVFGVNRPVFPGAHVIPRR
jgi:hypothetical protein